MEYLTSVLDLEKVDCNLHTVLLKKHFIMTTFYEWI